MTIQLYVGTYGKYASGSIAGKWLDLEDYADSEEFYKACKALHSNEHDPEFMFQDYEGFPACMYSESGNVDAIYEFIDLDDHEREIIEAYDNTENSSMQDIILRYAGTYDSYADYAEEYVDSGCAEIPSWLSYHVDYESLGKDLTEDMAVQPHDGSLWMFYN